MTDWSKIVEQHGSLVWRTAQRLLSNEADTADCFQRTFVSALELSRTETIRHWPALLRRLATARAIEQLRQRLRDRMRFASAVDGARVNLQIDHSAIAPNRAVEADELAEHLRNALAEIDSRQAEVFCLVCIDQCSYAEIAEQLKITSNHVGVLLNRAKASLRERLKEHDPRGNPHLLINGGLGHEC